VEAAALGNMDLFVRSEHGVDPYFHLSVSYPPDRWQKVWFLLRNDTDALLPMFIGSRLIPHPNRGMVWL
jgi:hypothetical protein